MDELKKLLESLNIKYFEKENSKESITYLCISEENHNKFPFRIIVSKKFKVLMLFSENITGIDTSRINEYYELMNDLNKKIAFGNFYIDSSVMRFYTGVSIEGTGSLINKEQLSDYIGNMKYNMKQVSEELHSNGLYYEQEDKITQQGVMANA